jgi:hypothetical protein
MEGRMKKIETAKEAADVLSGMSPAKVGLLVKLMKQQLPHLRGCSETEIRGRLRDFLARNS